MSEFKRKILVVDDEAGMRHMLRLVLEKEGYEVIDAPDAETGLETLAREEADVALCDIRMPGMDGLGFLREISQIQINPTVIMMSAYGSVDMALECMKQGAYDYISKPFKPDEVVLTIRKAEERLRLLRENTLLTNQLRTRKSHRNIAYKSEQMASVMSLVAQVADVRSPVLVTGETGTGKELIARALHEEGSRKDAPFIAVNCSAIAANLMESELFGHAKGSFTGADRHHRGLFEEADGGTLFLDEIGELPIDLQPKLLRVLQEGEVRRVGESKSRKVDVRVLAATARDLEEAAEKGIFRDDLFYRLAVVEIRIPSLRERKEDIPVLAEHFLKLISARDNRKPPSMTDDAITSLLEYDWPGNVRELENFMEKTVIFCREEEIDVGHMPWDFRRRNRESEDGLSLKEANERLEKEYIRKALVATEGNRTQAAKILEISLRALQYKIKEYDLK
jgi:two-component system response regulator AtoC